MFSNFKYRGIYFYKIMCTATKSVTTRYLNKKITKGCKGNTWEIWKCFFPDYRVSLIYLYVQLILVRADVNEWHAGSRFIVVTCVREISVRDVVVTKQVDLGQLAVDQSPGVNNRALEGVAPQNGIFLCLANDSVRNDGFNLKLKLKYWGFYSSCIGCG